MQFSNYPAGVSDAHPHFNPREVNVHVECGAEDATVVPSHLVKTRIREISRMLEGLVEKPVSEAAAALPAVLLALRSLHEEIEGNEDMSDFECPYHDERLLDESEEAQWVCPVCGQDRVTDTLPEDDPDRAREEHEDMMYEERHGN